MDMLITNGLIREYMRENNFPIVKEEMVGLGKKRRYV